MQCTTIPTSSKERRPVSAATSTALVTRNLKHLSKHTAYWIFRQVNFRTRNKLNANKSMTERLSLFGGALLPFSLWYNDPVQVTRAATQPVVSSHM